MLATTAVALALIATGTFQRLVAVVAFFLAANYVVCCLALIVLRRREPDRPRPFRAWGYPWSAGLGPGGRRGFPDRRRAGRHGQCAAGAVALLVLDSRPRAEFSLPVGCLAVASATCRHASPITSLRISCFEVLIGNKEIGFAEVGRLTSETEPGVSADRPVHRFPTVVLKRALTTSTELYDWRRLIVGGKDDRRDVTIRQLSAPGGKIVNAWRLTRAWPCRWSGPGLNAMSNDIAYEEIRSCRSTTWSG